MRDERGASLVELMVSLAVAGIVLALGATFFVSSQHTSGVEQGVTSLQRQSDRIYHLLHDQIENAGFGLPDSCGPAAVLSDWPGMTGPTGGYPWYPMAGTSSGGLSWVTSSNSLGNVAVTTITSMASIDSNSFQVGSVVDLAKGEGLGVEVPGTVCFVTYIPQTPTDPVTYPNESFGDLATTSGIPISTAQMTNARVYGLGNITARNLLLNGTDLQETISGQETNWAAKTITLSSQVLGWSILVGTGSPLKWEPAATWHTNAQNGNAAPIYAVQMGVVLASKASYPGAQTPTSLSLMGQDVDIPTAWRDHMVKAYVWNFSVRNSIWGNDND